MSKEPIGAVAPDGTRIDHWDERLRAAGCIAAYEESDFERVAAEFKLSRGDFAREARLAVACINEGGVEMAEDIAKSFGL